MNTRTLAAAVAAAALVLGTAAPAAAAPTTADRVAVVAGVGDLKACKGLLSPEAASLFAHPLRVTLPLGRGTVDPAIAAVLRGNGGQVCAWREVGAKNVIRFSITPISAKDRALIEAAWAARGVTPVGSGGANVIYHLPLGAGAESAYLLEDGYYVTATTRDGTWFPAFIQAQADYLVP